MSLQRQAAGFILQCRNAMSRPAVRYHFDMKEEPVLTARALIEWRCRQLQTSLPVLPDAAILTHQTSLLDRQWPWQRDRSRWCLSVEVRPIDKAVTLIGCRGIGSPATAAAIEEIAAIGIRRIVAINVCGSLNDNLRSGDVVLVTRAIAGDGTSRHYALASGGEPGSQLTDALGAALSTAGVPFSSGIVWSTDAVYRETPLQLQTARAQNAIAADMETAATLAVTAALGIESAVLLVAADELFDGWQPPHHVAAVRARLRKLLEIAIAVLQS